MSHCKKAILLLALLCASLSACDGHDVTVGPPTAETADQWLTRTQGTNCETISVDDPSNVQRGFPAVSCEKLVAAWKRAMERIRRMPEYAGRVDSVKMGSMFFIRPELHFFAEKPYPLIDIGGGIYSRGTTSVGVILIRYAYEECAEHEAVHAILQALDFDRPRTPEAIAADPGQEPYYGPAFDHFFQVQCHGTTDDLAGDGILGKRDQCALPYSGSWPN